MPPTQLFPWMQPAAAAPAAPPAPSGNPMQDMMARLSPEQRSMLMLSMLAGGAQGVGGLPRNASTGQALAALGGGLLGGRLQGMGMIGQQQREGRIAESQDRQLDLQEQALAHRQRQAEMEAAEAERKRRLIESMPEEQRRLYELFGEGARDLIHPKPPSAADRYRVVGGDLLDIAGDTPRVAYRAPQDPAKVTPYSDIAKLQTDLQRGLITPEQYEKALADKGGSANATALQQNAAFLARVKGISEGEAADFLLRSSAARSDPDKARNDIFKLLLRENYGDVQGAWQATDEAMRLLEGGPDALPAKPDEGPTKGVWAAIKGMFGGGEAAPETATEVAPQAAAPRQQPARPTSMVPLPPDPSALQPGQVYRLPDGRTARFDGQQFEVVE